MIDDTNVAPGADEQDAPAMPMGDDAAVEAPSEDAAPAAEETDEEAAA